MPPRLNRKDYGWSYTYAKDQRTKSTAYLDNFDNIQWRKSDRGYIEKNGKKVKVF